MTDAPPPGWYADPAGGGGQRWWDGTAWSQLVTPASPTSGLAAAPARPTDDGTPGYAIASLVCGITAVGPVAIGFGVAALRQLRRGPEGRGGKGFAIAGLVLGTLWTLALAALITLAAMGALDSVNEDDFTGEQRQVAQVLDDVEDAYNEDDEERACQRLFTPRLRQRYDDDLPPCERALDRTLEEDLGDEYDFHDFDAVTIEVDGARAVVVLEGGGEWVFRRQGGRWLLDDDGGPGDAGGNLS